MNYIPSWDELYSESSIMCPGFNQTINLKTKQKSYFKYSFISSINIIKWHANQQGEKKIKYSLWTMTNRIPGEMKQPPRSSILWAAWQSSLGMSRIGDTCTHTQLQNHAGLMDKCTSIQNPGGLPVLGGWEYGNGKKSKGNRFFSVTKRTI